MAVSTPKCFLLFACIATVIANNSPLYSSSIIYGSKEYDNQLLVSIPIYLDDEANPIHLTVNEGDSGIDTAKHFSKLYGFKGEQQILLQNTIEMRLRNLRRPSAHRIGVVVAYEDDVTDYLQRKDSTTNVQSADLSIKVLWGLIFSALDHHQESFGGIHVVLVLNGFDLSVQSSNELSNMLQEYELKSSGGSARSRRCASFELIQVFETIGFGSCINIALEHIDNRLASGTSLQQANGLNKHALVAVITSTMYLKQNRQVIVDNEVNDEENSNGGSEGGDIWHAYYSLSNSFQLHEDLVLFIDHHKGHSTETVQLVSDPSFIATGEQQQMLKQVVKENWANRCTTCTSRFPLIMFSMKASAYLQSNDQMKDGDNNGGDDGTYRFDEGYLLQGSMADFLSHAFVRNYLVDVTSLPFDFQDRFIIKKDTFTRLRYDSALLFLKSRHAHASFLNELEDLVLLDVDHFLASCLVGEDAGKSLVSLLQPNVDSDDVDYGSSEMEHQQFSQYLKLMQSKKTSDLKELFRQKRERKESLPFHLKWMGRNPSSVASAGWSDVLCIGAVMLVYDDALGFVDLILPELIDSVHHVLVLVSAAPWFGPSRSIAKTQALLAKHLNIRKNHGRLSVLTGHWKSEEEQRQFGNDVLKKLPIENGRELTHVLVVDGDEFWHPAQLLRSLSLVASVARSARDRVRAQAQQPEDKTSAAERAAIEYAVPFVRGHMATYWKSMRSLISPPEDLRILWLMSLNSCQWVKARELACTPPHSPIMASNPQEFNGLMIDPSAGVVHHLSYVRTTHQLIHQKLASFAHSQDVLDAALDRGEIGIDHWIEHKWKQWDKDNALAQLHPTHPPAYDHIEKQSLFALPPVLRSLHVDFRRRLEHLRGFADIGTPIPKMVPCAGDDFLKYSLSSCVGAARNNRKSNDEDNDDDDQYENVEMEEALNMVTLVPSQEKLSQGSQTSAPTTVNTAAVTFGANNADVLSHFKTLFSMKSTNNESMQHSSVFSRTKTQSSWSSQLHVGQEVINTDPVVVTTVDNVGKQTSVIRAENIPKDCMDDITPNFASQSSFSYCYDDSDNDKTKLQDASIDVTLLDPAESGTANRSPLCGPNSQSPPRILLLIVGEGKEDKATPLVFEEITKVVAHGLSRIGCHVLIKHCADLRYCISNPDATVPSVSSNQSPKSYSPEIQNYFTIIFGVHHLARYHYYNTQNELVPFVLDPVFKLFSPQTSVLYNFEHIAGHGDMQFIRNHSHVPARTATSYGNTSLTRNQILMNSIFNAWSEHDHLWDYSEGNVNLLRQRGFSVHLVPLGYAPCLSKQCGIRSQSCHLESETSKLLTTSITNNQSIDIMFYGKMNSRRAKVLLELRQKYNLRVFYANSNELVFGKSLEKLQSKSKIILNLCYYGSDDEWKFPRFMKPLVMNESLIISESCGGKHEKSLWQHGILFLNSTNQIALACRYYLASEHRRGLRIRQAYDTITSKPVETEMYNATIDLVKSICPSKNLMPSTKLP